jgi:hypothetical protein
LKSTVINCRSEWAQESLQIQICSIKQEVGKEKKLEWKTDEELLEQFSPSELISLLPAQEKITYINEVRRLDNLERSLLKEVKAIITFTELMNFLNLNLEQSQKFWRSRKILTVS